MFSLNSATSRSTTSSTLPIRLRSAELSPWLPSQASASALSRRRAGWVFCTNILRSSSATLTKGTTSRPISSFDGTVRSRSSSSTSNSMPTRSIASSSTGSSRAWDGSTPSWVAPDSTSLLSRCASDSPCSPITPRRLAVGVACSSDSTDSISRWDSERPPAPAAAKCSACAWRASRSRRVCWSSSCRASSSTPCAPSGRPVPEAGAPAIAGAAADGRAAPGASKPAPPLSAHWRISVRVSAQRLRKRLAHAGAASSPGSNGTPPSAAPASCGPSANAGRARAGSAPGRRDAASSGSTPPCASRRSSDSYSLPMPADKSRSHSLNSTSRTSSASSHAAKARYRATPTCSGPTGSVSASSASPAMRPRRRSSRVSRGFHSRSQVDARLRTARRDSSSSSDTRLSPVPSPPDSAASTFSGRPASSAAQAASSWPRNPATTSSRRRRSSRMPSR